jgi:hypothetical protein
MQTKERHTIVAIPNDIRLEVSYYTSDRLLTENERKDFTDLIIQLHDCHSSVKINRKKIAHPQDVEAIVQKTVINVRGHLCD